LLRARRERPRGCRAAEQRDESPAARTTGGYFYHLKPRHPNPQASDIAFQDRLLTICEEISGVDMA
jgi:hypothetical protein